MVDNAQGSETILLVEDEPAIRQLIRRMLEHRGFTILAARNGFDAMQLAQDYPHPIHLLLTDVVMPGLNGFEVADRLADTRPEMRVLFLSGYGESPPVRDGLQQSHRAFLPKPFTQDELAERIREVLDDRR